RPTNQDIVNTIRPGTNRTSARQGSTWTTSPSNPTQTSGPPTPASPARTRNQTIVKILKAGTPLQPPHAGTIHQPYPHQAPSRRPSLLARLPGWVWFVAGLLLLWFLMRRR